MKKFIKKIICICLISFNFFKVDQVQSLIPYYYLPTSITERLAEADQVKTLYTKLNAYVLELLTDSSLDMTSYDNRGMPKQINNKTRTTGMFGENSNSLIKEKINKQKVKPYNSIWSLYQ